MAATNSNKAMFLSVISAMRFNANATVIQLLLFLMKINARLFYEAEPTTNPQNLFRSNQDTLNQLIRAAREIHLLTQAELNYLSHEIKKIGGIDPTSLLNIQEPDKKSVQMLLAFLNSKLKNEEDNKSMQAEEPDLSIAGA